MDKILVPIDGSKTSIKAAKYAVSLAREYKSEVKFITIASIPSEDSYAFFGVNVENAFHANSKEMLKNLVERETKMLDIAVKSLECGDLKHSKEVVIGLSPYEGIIEFAKEGNFSLIVMGRRGFSKAERLFLGSVTQRVLSDAPCAVLVVNG